MITLLVTAGHSRSQPVTAAGSYAAFTGKFFMSVLYMSSCLHQSAHFSAASTPHSQAPIMPMAMPAGQLPTTTAPTAKSQVPPIQAQNSNSR